MSLLRLGLIAAVLVGCHSTELEPPPAPALVVQAPPAPEAAELAFVQQTEQNDCGPAAIASTLRYYGKPITLEESKRATHFHGDATSALDLVQAARSRGLGANGVGVDVGVRDGMNVLLSGLRTGDILYVDGNHFVVFEALAANGIRIVDPGIGHRTMDRVELTRRFSGVALLFASSPEAMAVSRPPYTSR